MESDELEEDELELDSELEPELEDEDFLEVLAALALGFLADFLASLPLASVLGFAAFLRARLAAGGCASFSSDSAASISTSV